MIANFAWSVLAGVAILLLTYLVKTVPGEARSAAAAAQEAKRVALDTRREMSDRLDAQDKQLTGLTREIRTNGGTSLKDAVLRVEAKVDDQTGTLAGHLTEAAYDKGKMEQYMAAHP